MWQGLWGNILPVFCLEKIITKNLWALAQTKTSVTTQAKTRHQCCQNHDFSRFSRMLGSNSRFSRSRRYPDYLAFYDYWFRILFVFSPPNHLLCRLFSIEIWILLIIIYKNFSAHFFHWRRLPYFGGKEFLKSVRDKCAVFLATMWKPCQRN